MVTGSLTWCKVLGTHLHIPGELIIAEDVHWRKLSNFIELEFNLDGLSIPRIVSPANPTLP
jgi:hypothetical protein